MKYMAMLSHLCPVTKALDILILEILQKTALPHSLGIFLHSISAKQIIINILTFLAYTKVFAISLK